MPLLAVIAALSFISSAQSGFPDGPNQQCMDDAGPLWVDDGPVAYYVGFPNAPLLPATGQCPPPLSAACAAKGALAAHMDGPVDCGGAGWFCRILDQPGHRMPGVSGGTFPDSNFASCNQTDTDHDLDGHCHGSDVDDTYGWWMRDHWHRNYAGRLKCCCDWQATIGVVNRCDYRKHVTPAVLPTCRDANEEHNVDWQPGCTAAHFAEYKEPPAETCWEITSFGPGPFEDRDDVPSTTTGGGGGGNAAPVTSTTTAGAVIDGPSWTAVDGGVGRACRGQNSMDNSPSYYTLREGLIELADCKAECEETEGCKGIEHRSSSGRCEVWTRDEGIQASSAISGYTCLRYGSGAPTADPDQAGFVAVGGGEDRACRGANLGDNSASYYIVHQSVEEMEECEAKCIATVGCRGIEFNGDLGRCEVWTRPGGIQATAHAPGFECLRYYAASPTMPSMLELPGREAAQRRVAPQKRKSGRHSSFLGLALVQRGAQSSKLSPSAVQESREL